MLHILTSCFLHSNLASPIVTLVIGQEQRIFAAHENVLCASPFFNNVLARDMSDSQNKRVALPDEEPEIFSSVLEFLYKGDYYPRLVHNKRRNSWEIEQLIDDSRGTPESTVYHHGIDGEVLKDTVIYCAAEKYGLEELKRVALRKQGLRMSVPLLLLFLHSLTSSQNRGSKPAPSLPPPDTLTPTHPTPTPSFVHTTWRSSSAVEARLSAAARCSWRCSTEAVNCSSTSSSPFATMSTTSRAQGQSSCLCLPILCPTPLTHILSSATHLAVIVPLAAVGHSRLLAISPSSTHGQSSHLRLIVVRLISI